MPVILGRLNGVAAAGDDVMAVEAACSWYPVCKHMRHMICLDFVFASGAVMM